ncbi:MAG: chitinase [Pseudomonadota bacterium]|nr:chitinase [Pseudomonadota bacterium]
MPITASVGLNARNDIADVTVVQILLNANRARMMAPQPALLKTDGRIGDNTLKAIAAFETGAMGMAESDCIVVPGDATMLALLEGLPMGPTPEKLAVVLPRAAESRIGMYFEPLKAAMIKYKITTPLQMAHFIAQVGHESGSLLYSEELASGAAYEGRRDLGNTHGGDGVRFKGRGLIQLTGRTNYTAFSKYSGVECVDNCQCLAKDPMLSAEAAGWFWVDRGLPALAERDDVRAVTKRINGGFNGLDDRVLNLFRAKAVLGL